MPCNEREEGRLTACDNGYEEECPCEITEERDEPDLSNVEEADAAVEKCCGHELHCHLVIWAYGVEIHQGFLTIILLVNKSAPLNTIMTKPIGNSIAPIVLMRPGAFS